jgi:hypothetical protein
MLLISLDIEIEVYLAEIIAQENNTSEELLKKLIYQYWQALAQRRGGGHPTRICKTCRSRTNIPSITTLGRRYFQGLADI